MSAHIPIDRLNMQACLFKLARAVALIESCGGSAIHIKLAIAALTDGNEEAADAWKSAQDDFARHIVNLPARNRLSEDFAGKRIIGHEPPTTKP